MDDEGIVLTMVITIAIIFIGAIVFAIVDGATSKYVCDFTAEVIDKDWSSDEDGTDYYLTFYHNEIGRHRIGISYSLYREIDIGDICRFIKREGRISKMGYFEVIGK